MKKNLLSFAGLGGLATIVFSSLMIMAPKTKASQITSYNVKALSFDDDQGRCTGPRPSNSCQCNNSYSCSDNNNCNSAQ